MSVTTEPASSEPTATRSRRDGAFAAVIIAASIAFMLWGIPLGIIVPANVDALPLSPDFLPYVLSGLIAVLGCICLAQTCLGRGVPKEDSETTFALSPRWPLRIAVVLTCFAVFWLLPERIGMLPVAVIVMAALIWAGGERRPLRGALVALLVPFGVWFFFSEIAQVPLPEGPIEEMMP